MAITYHLFGVPVTQKEFEMEPEHVDVKKYIIDESNVQRKMAFLNKVGMELFYKRVGGGNILDEEKNENEEVIYRLVEFDNKKLFSKKVIYLYMRNPSVGVYHLEPVRAEDLSEMASFLRKYNVQIKEDKCIESALHWRKPKALREMPIDEINGEEWTQQGDVQIWNRHAKSVRLRPSILT